MIFLLLVSAASLNAQSALRLGVHLDPLATWFSPKTTGIERDGARPGLSGGLIVEYYFDDNYGFVTGLSITALGGNILFNDSMYITPSGGSAVLVPAGTTVALHSNYLTIPIALKLTTNEIGYFTYYAQLGLRQWINISARATASGTGLSKDNIVAETNLFGMSYFFGGGLEYNMGGRTSITAGIFFDNGFVDVLSNDDYKAVLNYLSIRLGLLF
jgi:hypothetical protein